MNNVGTFGGFTTARLGVYAAQKGLSVTGNNIANINTVGYTRQRLDQVSLNTGGSDRYASQYDVRVGMGVLCTGVSQLRDPYLDIRYRTEMSSVGALDAKLSGLGELSTILDEVGKGANGGDGILEAQLSNLVDALHRLADNTGSKEHDGLVKSSAESIVKLFNTYSRKLEEYKTTTAEKLDTEVVAVNEILKSIRELNSSIRSSEIFGDTALEQRDQRNLLLDQLSEYMKIDVIYTTEDIGAGQTVEKMVLKLGNANPDNSIATDSSTLIDGIFATQLSLDPNNNYEPSLDVLKDKKGRALAGSSAVTLHDNDLYGSLQAMRELLTEKGEFASNAEIGIDPNAATKRGIPYYQYSLDLLANQFAKTLNTANKDGVPATIGGNLFSNSGTGNSSSNITAGNISISKGWAEGSISIVNTFDTSQANTTKNDNILHMISLLDSAITYNPKTIVPSAASNNMFTGSFQQMFTNTQAVLANDMNTSNIMLQTYYSSAVSLDTSRDSVSAVDLNDEATGLMQYQKSYAAACRLMTTLDEVLDKLINGTGIVGR